MKEGAVGMLFGKRKHKGKIYQCVKCGEMIDAETHKKNKSYCNGCVNDVNQLTQITYLSEEYRYLLDIKLTDLECKHVLFSDDRDTKRFIKRAEKAYYPNIVWGYYRDKIATGKSERAILDKMKADNFMRPIRIVVTSNGMVWCDNTHTCISYIERGYVTLKEIPFYVIVFTDNDTCAHVMDYQQSLSQNMDDINQAVQNAKRLEYFVRHNGRSQDYHWTVLNLYIQIGYNWTRGK